MDAKQIQLITTDIGNLRKDWATRNKKFQDWYDLLCLVDALKTADMESVALNDPRTFFNMALFLLTAGEIQHRSPLRGDSPDELDRQARLQRACEFIWREVDAQRQRGGSSPFVSELGFHLLLLGWYSLAAVIDEKTGLIKPVIWSPAEVYPRFEDGMMTTCVHEYQTTVGAAKRKANLKGWTYEPKVQEGTVLIDDYFYLDEQSRLQNIILIDSKPVTDAVSREDDLLLLVSPVGGFADKGAIKAGTEWRGLLGQGILETNRTTAEAMNKWMSMLMQNLRDTIQLKFQEFSAQPKAKPEQLRKYGSLFHYGPGEQGLQPVQNFPPPVESRALLMDLEKRIQKGGFSDAVYGMVERGTAGYALSQLTSSSANQILHPYMQTKDFVIEELDRFQLRAISKRGKAFSIKGRMEEELKPKDIPENVSIEVSSELATPRDWLERATIANMMSKHVDQETILSEVLKFTDTSAIKRKKNLDDFNEHPLTKQLKLITGYNAHADALQKAGDSRQAELFRKAAMSLEMQMGAPPAGAAKPQQSLEAEAAREEGAPEEKPRVSSKVAPPEARGGFSPQELRGLIGRGSLKRV